MNAGGVNRAEALLRMERRTDVISNSNHLLRTNDMNRLDLGKLDRGVTFVFCCCLIEEGVFGCYYI